MGVKEIVAVAKVVTVEGERLSAKLEIVPDAACHVIPEVSSAILLLFSSRMKIWKVSVILVDVGLATSLMVKRAIWLA